MRTILFCMLMLAAVDAMAMRCGKQLVTQGMNRFQVLERCGEPDDRNRRFEVRYRRVSEDESAAYEVEVEEWFYAGGPRDLDKRLIFVDGRMVREDVPGPTG